MSSNVSSKLFWIAAEIGSGAQITTCRNGPFSLLKRWHDSICSSWCCIVSEKQEFLSGDKMNAVKEFVPRLADTVQKALYKSSFPIILGGDHSCAIGTWSGVADFHRGRGGPIGLLWIDAHYDSHTFATSHSKAPHGMPLAALLGYGDKDLTHLYGWGPKIIPAYTVLLGVRSYEPEERDLLNHLQVRTIDINEIHERGIIPCIQEAINIVSYAPAGFGVTFDLDVIDPSYASGVGSPEVDGLTVHEAIQCLHFIKTVKKESQLLAFELVEYNPVLDDVLGSTAQICDHLINVII